MNIDAKLALAAVALLTALLNTSAQAVPAVNAFTVSPTTVIGPTVAGAITGVVVLNGAAPVGGQSVAITVPTADATLIEFPATVTVPAGFTSVNFSTIITDAVTSPVAIPFTATIGTSSQEATLTIVNPGGIPYLGNLQFFSVPYAYTNTLTNIFDTPLSLGEIAYWNGVTGVYDYEGSSDSISIGPGYGYWTVFESTGSNLSYLGTPASNAVNTTISLAAGWNSIGDPFAVPINIADLTFTKNEITFAQAISSTFTLISPILYSFLQDPSGLSGSYSPSTTGTTLFPGVGYWIYAYSPTTINFPPPGVPVTVTTTTTTTTTVDVRHHY